MDQHTQGRLQAIHGSYLTIVGTSESIGRCGTHGPHMANARRLAACWNACEGIPTDTLERYYGDQGGIDAALDEASLRDHTKAIQQRDQLLKALQAAVECSMVPKSSAREGGAMAYARQAQVADMIRDAIAACQPQPTVQHAARDRRHGRR